MKAEESLLLNWIRFFFLGAQGFNDFISVCELSTVYFYFFLYLLFPYIFFNLVGMNTQAPSSSLKKKMINIAC